MSFKKLDPVRAEDIHIGCLICSPVTPVLKMGRSLAVGFGSCHATKDNESVYDECEVKGGNYPRAQEIEDRALEDPDHDWRISFHTPMHEEVYQRQGDGFWVIVESGPGFA